MFFKLLLITCLALMTFMLASCAFSLEMSDCSGALGNLFPTTQTPPATPPEEPGEEPTGTFSIRIVESKTFYYPTYSGSIVLSGYPDKITLTSAGQEIEITPARLDIDKNLYTFTFEDNVFLLDRLLPGEHTATVNAFKGEESIFTKDYKFTVTEELECVGDRMDKPSNWLPPI